MNNKLFSFGISLALHLGLLMLALNSVIALQEPSSSNTPSLVRVKIDSRPYHSLAHEGQTSQESRLIKAPEMEMAQMGGVQKLQDMGVEHMAAVKLVKEKNELVTKENIVTVVKEKSSEHLDRQMMAERQPRASLMNAQDVFKNLIVSASGNLNASSSTPISSDHKVSLVKTQDLKKGPSAETVVSNHKGESPRISFERSANPSDIKSFLGYDLRTYEDPVDHSKYFKLIIRVGEVPGTLAAIPKEVVFLLDASNSIGPETLKELKKGIEGCFNQLGVNDKFNIMVFKNKLLKMSEESLPNNPVNIKKAKEFLAQVRAGLDTDIYGAVLEGIDLKKPMKPAYILLLSDGQPTAGVKEPQQVINQITQSNKGRVPIFGLGTGVFLDKYLMNFLAFTNRGWAEFSPNAPQKGVVGLYNHIKDPVLLNLRYYVSGLNEKEIYPKLLPDLFKGSQFVLYGQYTSEQVFYFQLFGDSHQGVKQYLITDDIASSPKTDKRIAQEWAIRKIYHLIGLMEYNKDNQDLDKEIKKIAKKFGLKIPTYELKKVGNKKTKKK